MKNNILKHLILTIFILNFVSCSYDKQSTSKLPDSFVYLQKEIKDINVDLRYYGSNNFVGQTINGYKKNVCICTQEAAIALKEVQKELAEKKLSLLIYDAYRPQRAVNHFIKWAKDYQDTIHKNSYYPQVKKEDLFRLNYIASKSSHSRGSTFDLTILDSNGIELDMGSHFDYFGPISWPTSNLVSKAQRKNRMLLQKIMLSHGFSPYAEEWWHFTLKNEPFPNTYFDFVVE